MNRKIRNITQMGLIVKMLNDQLDFNVIYKVRSDNWSAAGCYAVATSSSTVDEFDTELEARMVAA
jgi:hypothetical protein